MLRQAANERLLFWVLSAAAVIEAACGGRSGLDGLAEVEPAEMRGPGGHAGAAGSAGSAGNRAGGGGSAGRSGSGGTSFGGAGAGPGPVLDASIDRRAPGTTDAGRDVADAGVRDARGGDAALRDGPLDVRAPRDATIGPGAIAVTA